MTKEQKNAESRKRYYLLKSMHICTKCGCRDAEPKKTLCYICGEKDRIRGANRVKDMPDKKKKKYLEYHRTWGKMRYEMLKTEGLCVRCGSRRTIQGQVLCLECKNKARKREEAKKQGKIARSERIAYGLCYVCGKELENSESKLCSKCSEQAIKNLKSCTSATREHIWRKDNKLIFARKVGESDGK